MEIENLSFDDLIRYGEEYSSSMNDYLYAYDIVNDKYYISQRALERFKIPCSVFTNVAKVHLSFVYPDDREMMRSELEDICSGRKDTHNVVYRWLDHEENPIWINCRGKVICGKTKRERVLIGCINEVGANPVADNMSGLLRDQVFWDILHRRDGIFSGFVLRLGIDEFKELNERLGTAYGDKVIRGVADCIQENLEKGEQVYRIIGDEYLVVNDVGGTEERAVMLYNQIRSSIELLVERLRYEAMFTISGGVLANDGKERIAYNILQKKTLFAMNHAKELGRNQVYVYDEKDYERFLRECEITKEMRRSVNQDYKGFKLDYQPIIDQKTQKLYAAESLLRFETSTGELLSPVEFIPLLEKCGLIIPVGRWIMDTAMTMCEECQKTYPDFKISINLSYIQMLKSTLIEDFWEILNVHELSADSIILELTESGYLETSQNVMNIWQTFKKSGVCMAMDDFGTGYSNLKNIGRLSPDTVKIDRTFTLQALENEYEHKLLGYIIDMVHSLNLKLVIEGIETENEMEKISKMKPDYIQGYYYCRPCSADRFKQKYGIGG